MLPLRPCLFERKLLQKPWGGRALGDVLGIPLPPGEAIGESWELYDRPDGSSRLRGSELTLRDLLQQHGRELLGRARPGPDGSFPLAVKYIDARESLSVQVHPGDGAGPAGKSEAWVVLDAGPQARIIRGVQRGVGAAQLRELAARGNLLEALVSFRPQVGDCIYVPAGMLHAIGPDVVVFELQQNSDVTYRLHDWGRARELHVEPALAAAVLGAGAGEAPAAAPRPLPQGELLAATPHFRLRRLQVEQRATVATDGSFLIVSVASGRGMLGWHSGGEDAPLLLQPGDCALVPAAIEQVFLSPIGRLQVLLSDVGEGR